MQLKVPLRYHYIPIRLAKIKNMDNRKITKNVGKLNPSYVAGGNINGKNHPGKYLAFSLKSKQILSIDPSSCTPGRLSQKNENLCLQQKPVHGCSKEFYL